MRGDQFGIYEDYGTLTCGGYPGILNHLEIDAQTFAEWGVDYVKLGGCYSDPSEMDIRVLQLLITCADLKNRVLGM